MSWRVGVSSGVCTECSILEIVPAIRDAGATGIEVGTPPRHFDPAQEEQVTALSFALREAALEAVSIHAPFGDGFDLADAAADRRQAAIDAIVIAVRALNRLGGQRVVVHPSDLVRYAHDARARLEDSARSLQQLAGRCRAEGVTLVVESPLPHLIGGHPEEFAWLLNQMDDDVGVCLDTGHTALGRHWHQFLEVAGRRLVHVHANDNWGHRDDHLVPGDGQLDWREIGRSLRDAGFSGWLMLEVKCPDDQGTTEAGASGPARLAGHLRRALARTAELLGDGSPGEGHRSPGVQTPERIT
jgi:sugar phosphate isomerase/epimerase